jgi:hypothetical protein
VLLVTDFRVALPFSPYKSQIAAQLKGGVKKRLNFQKFLLPTKLLDSFSLCADVKVIISPKS